MKVVFWGKEFFRLKDSLDGAFSRLRRFFRENKDFEKRNAVFMGIQKTRKPEIEM